MTTFATRAVEFRGGLAEVVATPPILIAAGIEARGETAILHVASENVGAIRVYEALGFDTRAAYDFLMVQPPR